MLDNELKYKINLSFVTCNFLEDLFLSMKYSNNVQHEFKQNINNVLGSLRKINKLAEKTLSDEVLESFDKDKEILKILVDAELVANNTGRQTEFLIYIKDFFK